MAPRMSSIEKVFWSLLIPAILVIGAVFGFAFLQTRQLAIPLDIFELVVAMYALAFASVFGLVAIRFSAYMRRRHGRKWRRKLMRKLLGKRPKRRIDEGHYDF